MPPLPQRPRPPVPMPPGGMLHWEVDWVDIWSRRRGLCIASKVACPRQQSRIVSAPQCLARHSSFLEYLRLEQRLAQRQADVSGAKEQVQRATRRQVGGCGASHDVSHSRERLSTCRACLNGACLWHLGTVRMLFTLPPDCVCRANSRPKLRPTLVPWRKGMPSLGDWLQVGGLWGAMLMSKVSLVLPRHLTMIGVLRLQRLPTSLIGALLAPTLTPHQWLQAWACPGRRLDCDGSSQMFSGWSRPAGSRPQPWRLRLPACAARTHQPTPSSAQRSMRWAGCLSGDLCVVGGGKERGV